MEERYEWRKNRRQVKYCYRCRQLKSKGEFYLGRKQVGKYKYKTLGILCKSCLSEVRKERYVKSRGKRRY